MIGSLSAARLAAPGDRSELLVHLQAMIHEAGDAFVEGAVTDAVELDLGDDPTHRVGHRRAHQMIAMIEVPIDRPVRHAGPFGHRIDRRLDVALFEDLDHGVEHCVAISRSPQ